MNQLQGIAMNEGLRGKKGLWSKKGRARLESFPLAPWMSRRRQELLELLDRLNPMIDELSKAIEQEAEGRPEVQLLMTHPGVGPITALYSLCPNHWHSGTVSLRPADRKLSGADSLRGVQRRSPAAGTHHQARECADAFLAG